MEAGQNTRYNACQLMKKITLLALVGLAAALAFGQVRESQIAGTWNGSIKGSIPVPKGQEKNAQVQQQVAQANKMMKELKMVITMRANKTFTMNASGQGRKDSAEGTWALSGNTLNLTDTKRNGKDIPVAQRQKVAFTLSNGGKTMTLRPQGAPPGVSLVFNKS